MKSLLESDYVKIWVDDNLPIIFTRFLKMPDNRKQLNAIHSLNLDAIRLLEKRGQRIKYSICDASQLTPFPFEMLVKHYLEVIPNKIDSGLRIKTLVRPRSSEDQLMVLGEVKKMIGVLKVNVFEAFEQALCFIANDWMKVHDEVLGGY